VADFNGDGKRDLAVANLNSNTVTVLLGKGNGTFQAPLTIAAGNGPAALAVADFNKDGQPDLAVADFNSNGITVLLQLPQPKRATSTTQTALLSRRWAR